MANINDLIKCQWPKCCNSVRLIAPYNGAFKDFRCATCLGLDVVESKRPIPAGSYAVCECCHAQFKIRKQFYGKKPFCPICREQKVQKIPKVQKVQKIPKVPSLKETVPMKANNKYVPVNNLKPFNAEIDWENFLYPINSCLKNVGKWTIKAHGTVRKIMKKDLLDVSKLAKVYFAQEGENDEESWIFIAHHSDGIYVYFTASCDYTGFDCQGGGEVYYSTNLETFWNYCLDTHARTLLLK